MLMVNHLIGFGVAIPAVTFSPADITGLQCWYRADLGITKDGSDLVSTWADQSGNSRDLTEATNKPLYVASLINGQPAIRFDGTNDKLTSGAFSVSQPLTVFLVSKNVGHTAGKRVWASDNADVNSPNLVMRAGPNLTVQSNAADGPTVATDTTSYHYYKFIVNGTSSVISKDGAADQTSASDLGGSKTIQLVRLAHDSVGDFANVEIAEIFVYNSSISGSNLTSINAYFTSRYGL